jgi:hypothetical protein
MAIQGNGPLLPANGFDGIAEHTVFDRQRIHRKVEAAVDRLVLALEVAE